MVSRLRSAIAALAVLTILGVAIVAGSPTATTTALSTSTRTVTLGQPVTLAAVVTPSTATGAVTFSDGVTMLGTAAVSNGQAALTTTLLPAGVRSVTARYDGDATNGPSVSAPVTVTVSTAASYGLTAPTSYSAVADAGIAVADFNGDGYPDVVALAQGGTSTPGAVQVFLGGPGGSLTLSSTTSVSNPGVMAVGDLNGDGRPDIVYTDGQNVDVLFGNGDGRFTYAGPRFPAGGLPVALTVADLNGDGTADVAILVDERSSGLGIQLEVWQSQGTSLVFLQNMATPASSRALADGDFNSDGVPDLVVGAEDGTIALLSGNGNGTFAAPLNFATVPAAGLRALTVADLNGDGHPDIATANLDANSVTVLAGDGAGGFQPPVSYPTSAPVAIAATDVNGDGTIDLVTASSLFSGVDVLFNTAGSFGQAVHEASGATATALVPTELNGDGRADFILGGTPGAPLRAIFGSSFGVSANPNPSKSGQAVTFTATAPPNASGTVTFSDASTTLGVASLTSGSAVLTTGDLVDGAHTIVAQYSGDSTNPTASASVDVEVRTLSVQVTLVSSQNPSDAFAPVSFVATVTPERDTTGTPTGTVTFTDANPGGNQTATLSVVNGAAHWDRGQLYPGTHTITAQYNGDSAFAPLAARALTQTVTNSQECVFNATPNPAPNGASVTVTTTCLDNRQTIFDTLSPTGILSGNWTSLGDGVYRLVVVSSSFFAGTHVLTANPGPANSYSFVIQPPSTVHVVTNFGDAGPGTLRQAVADANPGDTIVLNPYRGVPAPGNFLVPITIALNSPIQISKPVTIDGPGFSDPSNTVTLDGQQKTRLLMITSDNVVIRGLGFAHGFDQGGDGGDGFAGGGGAAGLGGAVFMNVAGGTNVLFDNDRFTNNVVQGGKGGNGSVVDDGSINAYGSGGGGGMEQRNGGTGTSSAAGAGGTGGIIDGNGGQGAYGLGLSAPGDLGGGGGGGDQFSGYTLPTVYGGTGGGQQQRGTDTPDGRVSVSGDGLGGDGGNPSISENCLLIDSNISCFSKDYVGGSGGGGAGLGGAIFIEQGSLTVSNTVFQSNAARGGAPGVSPAPPLNTVDDYGTAATAGHGYGGAIYTATGSIWTPNASGSLSLGSGNSFSQNIGDTTGTADTAGTAPSQIVGGLYLTSPAFQTTAPNTTFASPLSIHFVIGGTTPAGYPGTFQIVGAHFPGGSRSAPFTTDANGNATSPLITADLATGTFLVSAVIFDEHVDAVLNVIYSAPSAISLAASSEESTLGDSATLTATVTRTPSGSMGGSVEFLDGVRVLGSAPLSNGTATFPLRQLPAGYHALRAIYTGDGGTLPSTSDDLWHVVAALPSQTFSASSSAGLGAQRFAIGTFTKQSMQAAAIVVGGVAIADIPLGHTVQTLTIAPTPTAIAAADFNGDGYTDVVVTLPGSFAVYLGGSNGLTAAGTISVTDGASVAIGDFNEDGRPDLAVVGPASGIQTWFGNGDGTFATGPVSALFNSSAALGKAVLADFNQDGHADLVILDSSRVNIWLAAGDGQGNFSHVATTTSGMSPADDLVVGDFDGDGWPDIATVSDDGSVTVSFGPFDPITGPAHTGGILPTGVTGAAIASADLDGDGFDDLIAGESDGVRVYYSHGDGSFSDPLTLPGTGSAQVSVGELSGDNRADIALLTTDGTLSVLAGGPGTPNVTWNQPNAVLPGTALGPNQLNASANENGVFVYTPAAGTVMTEGLQTLSVTFVPSDPAQAQVTTTTQIWVRAAAITWTPGSITWPQTAAPGPAQFNATANTPGTFTYTWSNNEPVTPGTPWVAGSTFTLHAHFVPNDLLDWPATDETVSIQVQKADPGVTWNPTPLPYGFPLGPNQFNATANVRVLSFIYADAQNQSLFAGIVPAHSGPLQAKVTVQPYDAQDYNAVTVSATIDVQYVPTTITLQPSPTIGCVGQTAHFNVGATATTLVYQWRSNGVPLVDSVANGGGVSGAKTSTLTLTPALLGVQELGPYDALVNETDSNQATMTVESAPQVTIASFGNPIAGNPIVIDGTRQGPSRDVMTMQWQFSPDNTTWTNIAGATADELSIPNSSTANNGFYRVVGSDGCGAATSPAVQVTVQKEQQQIGGVILSNPTVHYGDTQTLIGQASSGLPVSYAVVSGPVTVTGGQLHAIGIGAFEIQVTQSGNSQYAPAAPFFFNGNILPALLTAQLQPATRVYGSQNPAPTFTYTGLVNGDTPAVVTNQETINFPGVNQPAGVSSLSVQGALTAANYSIEIDLSIAQMTITPAPLTITASNATKVYGDTNPTFTVQYSGLVLGQTAPPDGFLSFNSILAGDGVTLAVGTYPIIPSESSQDYTITVVPGTFTVTPAPLTLTADNKTRAYGDGDPIFTATATGFKNFQTMGVVQLALATTATVNSPVGTYAITLGQTTAPNYTITFVPGTLTITPSSLTIYTGFTTKAYGAPLPSFANAVQIGGTHSDTETAAVRAALTFTTTATQSSDVGSYVVTANLTSPNYTTTINPGGLTITRVPLTVSVANATRIYGATNPAFQPSFAGFVLNQDPSVLGGALTFGAPDVNAGVGTYSITPGGLTSPDYTIAYVPGTLTITPATLTITANNTTRHYGYSTTLTANYSGLVASDTPASAGAVLTTTAVDASTPGTYPITVSGGPTSNYTITYVSGTLTIDQAPLNVQPKDATRNYGAPDPAFSVSYSGFVLGQDPSVLSGTVQVTSTAGLHSSVGTYALNASGLSSSNYSINYVPGRLNIYPIQLTVSGPFVTKPYGAPVPQFTTDELTYSGFILGDGPSVLSGSFNFLTDATQNMPAGQFTSVFPDPSNVKALNYYVVSTGGRLTVTKAPLTVQASSGTISYGQTPSFSATYSGFVLGETAAVLSGTLQFSPSASTHFTAGSYSITPGGLSSSNYSFQYLPGTLTVNAVPLTATVVDNQTTYGQPIPGFSVSYTGFQNGDDPSVLGGTLAFSSTAVQGSPVGSYPVTASGLTSSNYTIQFAPGTLTITPAPLTVTAVRSQPRLYGTPNPAFSVTYSGFMLNDGPQSLTGALTFSAPTITTSPGTYPVTPGGLSSPNYAVTYAPGSIQIVAAPLVVSVNPATKTFGQPNPAFTLSYQGFENGENPSVLSGTPVFQTSVGDTTPPGTSLVTVSGLSSPNYQLEFEAGQFTVVPANLVVSVAPVSRPYGSINPDGYSYTLTYSGLLPGYDVTPVYPGVLWTSPATSTSPVGQYPVTVVGGGVSSPYYNITYAPGTLTVTPAPLTITAASLSPLYGTSLPSPYPVFYNGFQNGESASVLGGSLTLTTPYTTTSQVGTYTIAPGGLMAQNYAITFVPGTITVRQATPTITFGTRPPNPVYPALPTAYKTWAQASVPGTFAFSPSLDAPLPPGCNGVSASFTPTDAVDYTGTSTSFSVCVDLGVQHIAWNTPPSLTYPQALDASVLNATVSADGGQATGALTYYPGPGATLDAGTHTLQVFAAATPYYAAASDSVTVTIQKGTQTITWPTPPAPLRFDQHFTSAQFTAVVNGSGPAAPGYISYFPSFLPNGVGSQTLTAVASPTNDYNQATSSIQVMVTPAPATCYSDNGYGEGLYGEGDVTPLYCSTETSYNSPFGIGETEPAAFPAGIYLPQFTYANPNAAAEYILTTTDLFYIDNPPPSITSLSQTSAVKESGPITIDIQGSGFVPSCGSHCPPVQCPQCAVDTTGTTVLWNAVAVPFTFVSPTEIKVTISADMLASSGVGYLTVSNYSPWGQPIQAVAPFFITDAPTSVEASASSYAWDPTVSLSTATSGELPDLTASTDDGLGSLTAAIYASSPTAGFSAGLAYYDVFAKPDPSSPFTQVTIQFCAGNPAPTDRIMWYDGTNWQVASNQTYEPGPPACIQVVVNAQTTPTLAQLHGTYFAIVNDPPPVITSVKPSLQQIWPPDNKMVPISINVGVTDLVTPHPACQIVNVSSNEPGTGEWQITGPLTLTLRASRSGGGTGRVYTIGVTCTNEAGLSSPVITTTVTVPHDQRK